MISRIIIKIGESFLKTIKLTPLFPHFLEFRKQHLGNKLLFSSAYGNVLEVGCGNCESYNVLIKNSKVISYLPTDYPAWEKNFSDLQNKGFFLNCGKDVLFNANQTPEIWADGYHLPFRDNSFDTWLGLEVLEHISEPELFLKEASRILKPQGIILLSVPFLYRFHGGPDHHDDYFRYTHNSIRLFFEKTK